MNAQLSPSALKYLLRHAAPSDTRTLVRGEVWWNGRDAHPFDLYFTPAESKETHGWIVRLIAQLTPEDAATLIKSCQK